MSRVNTTSHVVNQTELKKFFANVGSRTARDGASFQLQDWKHLKRFFSAVGGRVAIAEKKQRQRDRKEATRFNVFDLIDPDENKLSDVLADLLDPKGNHGQGDLFLRLLFKQLDLGPDAKLAKDATVRREVPTHGILKYLRRIDVLVETFMLLAIENKVDSIDQPEQVKDYLEHLRHCTQVRRAPSMLIYLTRDGRPPESISREVVDQEVAGKRLCYWSYGRDLRAWLKECGSQCEAPRIRDFLSDFVRYVDLVLKEEPETEQEQELREH
jgi:hypothetical protein